MAHISNSSASSCPGEGTFGPVLTQAIDMSKDAFNRYRVSSPFTLFDSQSRYRASTKLFSNVSGNATVTYLSTESAVQLSTGANGTAIRQSKEVFAYQPGKSLLIMTTFCVMTGTGRHRVGFFNEYDGIFFEYSGSIAKFVKRNQSSDTVVPRSSWNIDRLDGTGPSKFTLDTTKAQLMWIDLEWLGVGSVRIGFFINGQMVPCHTWHHANYTTGVYMTTAILPIRYEVSGSNASLKEICATVLSEGGYDPTPLTFTVGRGTTNADLVNLGPAGTVVPLISLRLRSDRLYGYASLRQFEIFNSSSSDGIQWYLVYNATLTTPTWAQNAFSNVAEYDISSSSITGGKTITGGFIDRSGKLQFEIGNSEIRVGQSDIGTSEILTLAASGFANNLSVAVRVVWYEI